MKDDYQIIRERLEEFCSLKQLRRALSRSDDAGWGKGYRLEEMKR